MEEEGVGENVDDVKSPNSISELVNDLIYNPVNMGLICVIAFLLYQMFLSRKQKETAAPPSEPQLARMKKQDMTAQQLRKYDGTNKEGRVCVAVNGKIFDVSKGKRYYGPGGPYAAFAGRDASRGLATFTIEVSNKDYDDLSDLNTMEMEGVKEWEIQFQEKYEYVGRLLKPGEDATDYSDDEDNSQDQNSSDQASKKESSSDQASKKEISVDQASKKETSPNQESEKSTEVKADHVFQELTRDVIKELNCVDEKLDLIEESAEACEAEEKCQSQMSGESQNVASGEPVKEMEDKKLECQID